VIQDSQHSTAELWKNINKILHHKNKTKQMPEKIMFKGKILDNSKSISNAFNNYFVNVSASLCNSISASTNCNFTTTSLI